MFDVFWYGAVGFVGFFLDAVVDFICNAYGAVSSAWQPVTSLLLPVLYRTSTINVYCITNVTHYLCAAFVVSQNGSIIVKP